MCFVFFFSFSPYSLDTNSPQKKYLPGEDTFRKMHTCALASVCPAWDMTSSEDLPAPLGIHQSLGMFADLIISCSIPEFLILNILHSCVNNDWSLWINYLHRVYIHYTLYIRIFSYCIVKQKMPPSVELGLRESIPRRGTDFEKEIVLWRSYFIIVFVSHICVSNSLPTSDGLNEAFSFPCFLSFTYYCLCHANQQQGSPTMSVFRVQMWIVIYFR